MMRMGRITIHPETSTKRTSLSKPLYQVFCLEGGRTPFVQNIYLWCRFHVESDPFCCIRLKSLSMDQRETASLICSFDMIYIQNINMVFPYTKSLHFVQFVTPWNHKWMVFLTSSSEFVCYYSWWRNGMETHSASLLWPMHSPHIVGQVTHTLAVSLFISPTNCRTNNPVAGDFIWHDAHVAWQ